MEDVYLFGCRVSCGCHGDVDVTRDAELCLSRAFT